LTYSDELGCHLRENPARLSDITLVDDLYESSHYGVWISRCDECGQQYLACYVEIFDDSWSFYAPISEDEAVRLRIDPIHEDSVRVKELITSDLISCCPRLGNQVGLTGTTAPRTR
jgi:hypothetical protein